MHDPIDHPCSICYVGSVDHLEEECLYVEGLTNQYIA